MPARNLFAPPGFRRMQSTFASRLMLALCAVLVGAGLAAAVAQPAPTGSMGLTVPSAEPTEAEEMFADAPYGVDPMPTGPVSAAFKQNQRTLDCANATWPDIPAACYPK